MEDKLQDQIIQRSHKRYSIIMNGQLKQLRNHLIIHQLTLVQEEVEMVTIVIES